METAGWIAFAAVGALLISAAALASTILGKALSVREHEEFKNQEQIKATLIREHLRESNALRDKIIDILRDEVVHLRQTVPTAGQLEDATSNLKERIIKLEQKKD